MAPWPSGRMRRYSSKRPGGAHDPASDGVSVVVRGVDGDTAYCVTTSNEHGEESQEHCG